MIQSADMLPMIMVAWLVPTWIMLAIFCEKIALRKQLDSGAWFFRGLLGNVFEIDRLLQISSQTSGPNYKHGSASRLFVAYLLLLLSIPFVGTWLISIAQLFPSNTATSFGVLLLAATPLWILLVWSSCIVACYLISRHKGLDPRLWVTASIFGTMFVLLLLIQTKPVAGSIADRSDFLRDGTLKAFVLALWTAVVIPFFAATTAIFFFELMVYRWSTAGLLLDATILLFFFTAWVMPALACIPMCIRQGRSLTMWCLLAFGINILAPVILSFLNPVPATASGGTGSISPDPIVSDLVMIFLLLAGLPALVATGYVIVCPIGGPLPTLETVKVVGTILLTWIFALLVFLPGIAGIMLERKKQLSASLPVFLEKCFGGKPIMTLTGVAGLNICLALVLLVSGLRMFMQHSP